MFLSTVAPKSIRTKSMPRRTIQSVRRSVPNCISSPLKLTMNGLYISTLELISFWSQCQASIFVQEPTQMRLRSSIQAERKSLTSRAQISLSPYAAMKTILASVALEADLLTTDRISMQPYLISDRLRRFQNNSYP